MSVRRGAHVCTYKRQRAVVSGGFAVKPVDSCIFHGLSATRFARELRVSGSAVAGARSRPRVWREAWLRPGALVLRSSLLGKSQPLLRASLSSCFFRILLRTWRSSPGQIWGGGGGHRAVFPGRSQGVSLKGWKEDPSRRTEPACVPHALAIAGERSSAFLSGRRCPVAGTPDTR